MTIPPFADLLADPALRPFLELVHATNEGRAPDPAAVAKIAEAATVLFADGPMLNRFKAFAHALGCDLRKGKGRKKDDTSADVAKRLIVVGFMLKREAALIAEGMPATSALGQAKRDAMTRFHMTLRNVQLWRAELHERAAELLIEVDRENKRMLDAARRLSD